MTSTPDELEAHVRTFSLLTAGLVAAATVAAPAAAGRDDHKNKIGGSEPQTFDCGDSGDLVIFTGDEQLWPPNHKYAPYTIEALDADGDGDNITLTTGVSHDEYLTAFVPTSEDDEEPEEEHGAGNTQDDARPLFDATMGGSDSVTHEHEIRAERSGRGDGRTYTFYIHAEFDQDSCDIEVPVNVPHDMRSDNAPPAKDRTDG